MHCLKTNLNLCIKKTEPVSAGGDATVLYCTVYIWLLFTGCTMYIYLAKKPDKCRCIGSHRDRLGFHAEIQISLGDSVGAIISVFRDMWKL